jgi:hypothetical protein
MNKYNLPNMFQKKLNLLIIMQLNILLNITLKYSRILMLITIHKKDFKKE